MHPEIWDLLAYQQKQSIPGLEDHLATCSSCLAEFMQIDLDQTVLPQARNRTPRFRIRQSTVVEALRGFQLLPSQAFRSQTGLATIHSAIVPLGEQYLIFELRSSPEALELAVEKGGPGPAILQFYCNDRLVEQSSIEDRSVWDLQGFAPGHYNVFAGEKGPRNRKILEFNLRQDTLGSKERNHATA